MSLERRYAVRCDRCHARTQFSEASAEARRQARRDGYARLPRRSSGYGLAGRDLCPTCWQAVVDLVYYEVDQP